MHLVNYHHSRERSVRSMHLVNYHHSRERSVRSMHLGMFVSMSVQMSNSKTIVPMDFIFYARRSTPVARSSSKLI